jgi:alpha-maltose-1-phosphate synthase
MRVGVVVFDDVDYGLDLAAMLHVAGQEVCLYLSEKHVAPYVGVSERPVERMYEVGLLPPECRVRLYRLPRMSDPRSLGVARQIARDIRGDEVDLLHILVGPGELWPAALSHLVARMPVAATMIIPKPNVGEHLPAWVPIAVYRLLAWGSDIIIVNGADQVAQVRQLYGVPDHRIAYVPLGPRTTAVGWSLRHVAEDPATVLFFGEARRHKGLEYLVRAQPLVKRRVPEARMLIVSRGEELERCRLMMEDGDGFEVHTGFVPGEMAAEYFQRAAVVALPYLSASTSGILMTAYAFGKPVVATRVGCLPEYVQDGVTGLLAAPADVEDLADALARLLADSASRRRMGEEAQRWVSAQRQAVARETLWAYHRAIAQKGRAKDPDAGRISGAGQ